MSTTANNVPFARLEQPLARLGSAVITALASLTVVLSGLFFDDFTTSRVMPVYMALIILHCLICPKLFIFRELGIYFALTVYFFLSLFWTPDGVVAMNTLFPASNFVLILLLFGSLLAYHDPRAVVTGALVGFWAGAAAYTAAVGFPFVYPAGFSYNGIAAVYLYGLLVTMFFGWVTGARALTMLSALVVMGHIVASTSIKTNLGVLIGVVTALVFYFRRTMREVRRSAIYLGLALVGIVYAVMSSKAAMMMISGGFDRIVLGLDVLQTREDKAGYSGFGEREYWMREGLLGWTRNPLFGHGAEAFRADYGATSHSTPVDLLYNTGLIGTLLFFGMFASIAWRPLVARNIQANGLHALVLAGIPCYLFASLSGTIFYQSFMAIYVAFSVALVVKAERQV